MADKSNIEWTDATWPIVQGCDPVSEGCVHCYAVPLLWRMMHHPDPKISGPLQGLVEKHVNAAGEEILRFTGKLALREDRLDWPLNWKRPRMIFVPSHGDLFHKDVPDEFIDKVFARMALCPQHTFQVLTKRAERMRDYVSREARERIVAAMWTISERRTDHIHGGWPMCNVWLGVSAERQQEADERIPLLLQTPAAVRFLSAEPLLGPIDLRDITDRSSLAPAIGEHHFSALPDPDDEPGYAYLDWIIVGGESGKDARPMHPEWARSLRQQCETASVEFFFKQWGAWAPSSGFSVDEIWRRDQATVLPDGRVREWQPEFPAARLTDPSMRPMTRVGKQAAGRLLDGKEHNEFPKPAPASSASQRFPLTDEGRL